MGRVVGELTLGWGITGNRRRLGARSIAGFRKDVRKGKAAIAESRRMYTSVSLDGDEIYSVLEKSKLKGKRKAAYALKPLLSKDFSRHKAELFF